MLKVFQDSHLAPYQPNRHHGEQGNLFAALRRPTTHQTDACCLK
ncbi:MAG TPA: hypothetical protein VNQ90_09910 [Chthoniobacteraceae bacterium]|nr:hypothetical protein [Chthoniobacteraceae bacterium]